jgi:hypothetical protein
MYAKVFSQIYDGTLCTKGPWQALVTFQQLLVLADPDGNVDMTAGAIARRTTIPLEIIETGIAELVKPDPESRTPTEGGRRIVPLADGRSWGWRVVNYKHYRDLKREEDRRAYHREYWHKRKGQNSTGSIDSTETQHTQPNQPRQETETVESRENIPQPPSGAEPAPKPKRQSSPAIGLKAWLSGLKARGEKPVPPDDPIFDYATRVKLPEEFLSLAWMAFKHRYTTQHPDKRYRDWRKVFRNAVEGNWSKLWWLDPAAGTYGLTTVGQQAKRDHDARAAA